MKQISSRPSSRPSSTPNSYRNSSPNSCLSSKPGSKCKSRFSVFSERVDREELVEEYRNIILDRQTRQVLMLCTDLKDKQRAKHVVDSAIALRNIGHKVTMVTTDFDESIYCENLAKIGVVICGRWIPKSIHKLFKDAFYFIRCLYSTLYMIYFFRNVQPKISVVFCETHYCMVPIIKYFTDYRVILFQYAFNLSQYRLPASKIKFKGTWFPGLCLKGADEILVPNKVFYDIYRRSFSAKINPNICEPYLNVQLLKREKLLPLNHVLEDVKKETILFLVLAEYHPRSNLELALDSFHLLVHSSSHATHSRYRLVVAGHAGRGRLGYVRSLAARVRHLHLDSRVLLHPRPTRRHKKALLAGCRALLSCQPQGLWDRYVLEAMALGRPVIAVDSGFTAEVLEHGVTGYLVASNPGAFTAAMAEVAGGAGKDDFIGKMAHCEFLKTYSLEAYAQRLHQLLTAYTAPDKDDKTPGDAARDHKELFFG